ncbi:MAG: hypothetical protein WD627_00315 [Actinomycetota bacterium]
MGKQPAVQRQLSVLRQQVVRAQELRMSPSDVRLAGVRVPAGELPAAKGGSPVPARLELLEGRQAQAAAPPAPVPESPVGIDSDRQRVSPPQLRHGPRCFRPSGEREVRALPWDPEQELRFPRTQSV